MLKLAGFNSTIYSFNKKTGVSFTPRSGAPTHRNIKELDYCQKLRKVKKSQENESLKLIWFWFFGSLVNLALA